jgi:UDP-N-acetylmuramoyl-tripeptide--D-alanyl-D-alanine ligase
MEPRSLKYICAAWAGERRYGSPDTLVSRICTDSRQAQPGDLFFALAGERFDGHNFLAEVAKEKVAGLVVERTKAPATDPGCAVLVAENTRHALGRLAARYRTDFNLPIVAVSGSNGKTTTKELLAAVLSEKFATLWSEASFNNDIGVPVTLLKLERNHGVAVLEAGTNHPGELAPLLQMIQPRFGVITSLGREHLEFFGDLSGVADEEGWLAELLPADGTLVINGDDEWTPHVTRRAKAKVVRVGFNSSNDWRATNVRADDIGITFQIASLRREFNGEYRVNLLGRHQAVNAMLAAAVGAELGLSPDDVRRGLTRCKPPKMRLQVWEANGVRVLDDSYNANADSMLAALQTLHDLPAQGRRIAVLGDMAELGKHSAAAHAEIGRRAAELKISCLIAVGQWARETATAARAAGLEGVSEFVDVPSAAAAMKEMTRPGDLVLLKASRAVGLERVGDALRTNK